MEKEKSIILFYSRTGNTKKIASMIKDCSGGQLEEITDLKKRAGLSGWLSSGFDGFKKKMTEIKTNEITLEDYTYVFIGTPVWGGNMSPSVRTFLHKNKDNIKNLSLFVSSGSGESNLLSEANEITRLIDIPYLEIKTENTDSEESLEKIKDFVKKTESLKEN